MLLLDTMRAEGGARNAVDFGDAVVALEVLPSISDQYSTTLESPPQEQLAPACTGECRRLGKSARHTGTSSPRRSPPAGQPGTQAVQEEGAADSACNKTQDNMRGGSLPRALRRELQECLAWQPQSIVWQAPMLKLLRTPSCSSSSSDDDEPDRFKQLQRARRRLDKVLGSEVVPEGNEYSQRYHQALEMLQQRVAQFEGEVEENRRIKLRLSILQMELQLVERDRQQWLRLSQPMDRRLAGSRPGSLPPSGILVSVEQLPDPGAWDQSWDDRVLGLTTVDLLVMHRQWVQHCSMLLPKAEFSVDRQEQACCRAHEQLTSLYDNYNAFVKHVIALIPQFWMESVSYDLETMAKLTVQPDTQRIARFCTSSIPHAWRDLTQVLAFYHGARARLSAEHAELQHSYDQLLASGAGSGSDTCGAASTSGMAPPECDLEGSDAGRLLMQLQENLRQQGVMMQHAVEASHYCIPMMTILKTKVALYPLALTGQMVALNISGSETPK